MKHVLLALLLFPVFSYAQTAASYLFSTASQPFTNIATTGTASTINGDDHFQTTIPIGFQFNYCGVHYTTLYASSNGYISLPNTLPATGEPSAYNMQSSVNQLTNGKGLLCPFWDDLDCTGRIPHYTTSGDAPNRVFVFEWVNAGLYGGLSGATADSLTFQVKLFETSGVIQFCYNRATFPTLSATIGIFNSPTDFQTLNNSTPGPIPSTTVFYNTIDSLPHADQVYIWTPPGITAAQDLTNNSNLSVYPNPVHDELTIENSELNLNEVLIYNALGQIIFSKKINNLIEKINCSSWPKGTYFIKLRSEGGIVSRKIVKN